MTEIVQRFHGIHVEFHAKLAEIPGKFRIHPATFMCRHVKMRQTVYPLRVQCLCERQSILFKIQFMQLLSRFFHRGVASSRAPARRESPIMERTGEIVPHTSVQVNANLRLSAASKKHPTYKSPNEKSYCSLSLFNLLFLKLLLSISVGVLL